jgi:hypothetical protein
VPEDQAAPIEPPTAVPTPARVVVDDDAT